MKRTKSQTWIQQPSAKSRQPFKKPRRQSIGASVGAIPSKKPEKKNIDTQISLATPGATWTAAQLLNPIVQGTGVSGRVGRQVNLKSVFIRWVFTGTQTPFRFVIIYDKQPNGALPATTDIFSVNSINGLMTLANSDRFKVIHDEYIYANGGSNQGNFQSASNALAGKYFRDFGEGLQNIWTDAATGTIADISTGALYYIANSIVATGAAGLVATTRVRYTDQ